MIYFKSSETARKNRFIRYKRLIEARTKGTHTDKEWLNMKSFFNNTCCNCFGGSGLLNVEKDHIIPLYAGGSDSIKNLQPLCAKCNVSKKDFNDHRQKLATKLNKILPENYKNPY